MSERPASRYPYLRLEPGESAFLAAGEEGTNKLRDRAKTSRPHRRAQTMGWHFRHRTVEQEGAAGVQVLRVR